MLNAFDHFIRARKVVLGIGKEDKDYIIENYNKIKAHLCRAEFDAYDIISIWQIDEINEIIRNFDRQTIFAVIGGAAENIYKNLEDARDKLIEAKMLKDIENSENADKACKLCEEANALLKYVLGTLRNHENELYSYYRKRVC